jgi:hypothetical protein
MKRSRNLKIALSEGEYDVLFGQAEESGISMAGVVRSAVLGLPLPKRRARIDVEAVAALNRLGSNLNQLVRTANSSGVLTAPQIAAVGGVLKKVAALSAQIHGRMGNE